MTKNEAKESLTVFAMANAAGEFPPPFIILPRQHVPDAVYSSVSTNEDMGASYYNTTFP